MHQYPPLAADEPRRLGEYEILTRLGEGGQGVVYLGRSSDGELVAVKLLHHALVADPEARTRFLREVAVAQRVARFCTAPVLHADLEGSRPYIVTDYVPGPSLRQLVDREGPRRGAALDRLAISTVTALAAIHRAGILHRDFKPGNVLMGPEGPVVIDFGIAKALDSPGATATGLAVGTPAYLAPEQLAGAPASGSADIFAWGVTMVFAATGRPAFGSDSIPAVMNRILNEEPEIGQLDGLLGELVPACLAKDPSLRPTADQLIAHLTGQQTGQVPRPAPVPMPVPHGGPPPMGHGAGFGGGDSGPRSPATAQTGGGVGSPGRRSAAAAQTTGGTGHRSPQTDGGPGHRSPAAAQTAGGTGRRSAAATRAGGGGPSKRLLITAVAVSAGVLLLGGGVVLAQTGNPFATAAGGSSGGKPAPMVSATDAGPDSWGEVQTPEVVGNKPSGKPAKTPVDRSSTDKPSTDANGADKGDETERPAAKPSAKPAAVVPVITPKAIKPTPKPTPEPTSKPTSKPTATAPVTVVPPKVIEPDTGLEPGGTSAPSTAKPTVTSTTPKPTVKATTKAPVAPPQANPYTAKGVCGAGYAVIDSHALGANATIYLLYKATGAMNCVVTMSKYVVPAKTSMNAKLQVQNGASGSNPGSFSAYAGPVRLTALKKCVIWGGSWGSMSWTSGWSHCT